MRSSTDMPGLVDSSASLKAHSVAQASAGAPVSVSSPRAAELGAALERTGTLAVTAYQTLQKAGAVHAG